MKRLFNYFSPSRRRSDNHLSNERIVHTKIGGKKYEIASDDNYLEHIKGEFEPEMVVLFKSLIRSNDVVLDVGANIGCTSILFGNLAEKVYCFEPSPTTFGYLEKNVKNARLDRVTPVNVGLGKESGMFELTFSQSDRSGGFVSNLTSASQGHQVEQIKIIKGDDFMNESKVPKIDFIKIDVEGFEKSVIEGLSATIARDQPIVVLELNHWCLNALQRTSVPDFFDFLRSVFPHLYAVDMSYVRNFKDRVRRKLIPSLYDVKDAKNLHDLNASYHVMNRHILNGFSYPILVGAFDKAQLETFSSTVGVQIS
ncbi:MAG: FkbM family methyltransferase [Sheuella sp.]|nr:FkbM family methyltransferase [Sheuella sp.]